MPNASAASTTIATAPVSVIVESYDAETLDGRVVTIRAGEGALSSFTEGVPSEMHAVQLLAEAGNCEQISSTGDLWASLADETDEGLKASAFAKRAYDVHTFIKCAPNEPGGEAPANASQSETDPRFDTCGDVNDAGLGPYVQGVDPEYDWYLARRRQRRHQLRTELVRLTTVDVTDSPQRRRLQPSPTGRRRKNLTTALRAGFFIVIATSAACTATYLPTEFDRARLGLWVLRIVSGRGLLTALAVVLMACGSGAGSETAELGGVDDA